jgi:hypothetical protein
LKFIKFLFVQKILAYSSRDIYYDRIALGWIIESTPFILQFWLIEGHNPHADQGMIKELLTF